MTNEQINISIAEACGWKRDKRGLGWLSPHGYYAPEPDYCNDLNAMHGAEKILTRDQIEVFCDQLLPKHHGIWWGIHTTSHQRAEAFLRTLGKWEE
jgi:hypothetical protein